MISMRKLASGRAATRKLSKVRGSRSSRGMRSAANKTRAPRVRIKEWRWENNKFKQFSRNVARGKRNSIHAAGSWVRNTARNSLKRKTFTAKNKGEGSPAGTPPFAWNRYRGAKAKSGRTRRLYPMRDIRYAVMPGNNTVHIGSMYHTGKKKGQAKLSRKTVPSIHEHGGSITKPYVVYMYEGDDGKVRRMYRESGNTGKRKKAQHKGQRDAFYRKFAMSGRIQRHKTSVTRRYPKRPFMKPALKESKKSTDFGHKVIRAMRKPLSRGM